jgi:uncharacterized protein (DUF433 family)
MVTTEYKHIVKDAGYAGGMARVEDTRIPVAVIVGMHIKGDTIDAIVAAFPNKLTEGKVYSALAYYADNRAEIERDLAQIDAEPKAKAPNK